MPEVADSETGEIRQRFIRPFEDWLLDQREGACASELSAALNELITVVDTMGGSGSLTLKISVKPFSKNSIGSMIVADEITLKLPKTTHESFHFVDPDKNLTRNNPNQLGYDGPLLEVPERHSGPAREVRS